MDYVCFIYGLSIFFIGYIGNRLRRIDPEVSWKPFILFSFLHGFSIWLRMLQLQYSHQVHMESIRIALYAVSFVVLFVFALGLNRRRAVWYSYPFLLLLFVTVLLLSFFNVCKTDFIVRIALVLPASIYSASVFRRQAAGSPKPIRVNYLLIAYLALIYGIIIGVFTGVSDTGKTLLLDQAAFKEVFIVPVHLIRAILMIAISLLLWKIYIYFWYQNLGIGRAKRYFWSDNWLLISIGITIISGFIMTEVVGRATDVRERLQFLTTARIASRALGLGSISRLEGNVSDLAKPEYHLLKTQLMDLRKNYPSCRFIYLNGIRSDQVFIYVDSESPDSIDCSPPGDLYYDAGDEFLNAVRQGSEAVTGPTIDRWGTWVSAIAPVHDPINGKYLAALAMDINADDWFDRYYTTRLLPITVTLIFIILIAGFYFHHQGVVESNWQLLISEERLETALQGGDLGLWDVDLVRNKMVCNPRIGAMLELPAEKMPQDIDSLHQMIHPHDFDRVRDSFSKHLDGREIAYEEEYRIRKATGDYIWVLDKGKVIDKDNDGRPIRIAGSLLNIMTKKSAEKSLKDSEERFRIAVIKMREMVYDYDLKTRRIIWVGAITEITGFTEDEFSSFNLNHWYDLIETENRQSVIEQLEASRDSLSEYNHEYRIRRKDGKLVQISDHGVFLRDNTGSNIRLMGIVSDITDRKKLEEKRMTMERNLLHAQKLESLGVMAGGVAHDFNNLLMAIIGNLDLANYNLENKQNARAHLQESLFAAMRAADLTKQLLTYSGKGQFSYQVLNLNLVIKEMQGLLKTSISKAVKLELLLDPNLPLIRGDKSQLEQVILNLIVNSSEAIGDKEGIITARTGHKDYQADTLSESRLEETIPEGNYIFLEVEDNGCGMDERTIQRLFEPFFTTKFTGRGLGMSAVLGIVKSHDGAIFVKSQPGKGSRLTILFPPSPVQEPIQPEQYARFSRPLIVTKFSSQGSVLVIDDEEHVRTTCATMIDYLGLKSMQTSLVEEGIRLFRENQNEIICVIVDLAIPKMDCPRVTKMFLEINPAVKIVLSSGYGIEELIGKKCEIGFFDIIKKPYDLIDLHQLLKKIVEID